MVDKTFPVALSAQRNLDELADKILTLGHGALAWNGEVMGGISWYDNDVEVAYINILAVLPQYRRLGIARKLLEYVFGQMPDRIRWVRVRTRNLGAFSLYEQCGFVPESSGVDISSIGLEGCYLRKPLFD